MTSPRQNNSAPNRRPQLLAMFPQETHCICESAAQSGTGLPNRKKAHVRLRPTTRPRPHRRLYSYRFAHAVGSSLKARDACRLLRPAQSCSSRFKGCVLLHRCPRFQPEGELVNVLGKMLFADLVRDAVHAALENRPDAFNTVRGSGTLPNIFPPCG